MFEVDTFLTIKGNSDSLLKEKGSKFIGFATHVNDESEIKTNLDSIRKELHWTVPPIARANLLRALAHRELRDRASPGVDIQVHHAHSIRQDRC